MICRVVNEDSVNFLKEYQGKEIDLTFLDPPFNQARTYRNHDDDMSPEKYWAWMTKISALIYDKSSDGAAIYFMQREKNTRWVMQTLEDAGWHYQSLIVWKKKTSAVPSNIRYGKHYQIIAYYTKGAKPRVFHKMRIDPPLLVTEKHERKDGLYLTDVWDDIRELTSGYFAGKEPLRLETGERAHKQQAPIRLLARILLSSTQVSDMVLDPFAGTGTTLSVAKQLQRNSIGVELDPINCQLIDERLACLRESDDILKFRKDYRFTKNLDDIWVVKNKKEHSYMPVSRQEILLLEERKEFSSK